jgi:hypothetical protein
MRTGTGSPRAVFVLAELEPATKERWTFASTAIGTHGVGSWGFQDAMGRRFRIPACNCGVTSMDHRMFHVIVAGGLALVGCGGGLDPDAAGAPDGAPPAPDATATSNDASSVVVFPSELPSLPIDASLPRADSDVGPMVDLDSGLDAYADAATDVRIGVPIEVM